MQALHAIAYVDSLLRNDPLRIDRMSVLPILVGIDKSRCYYRGCMSPRSHKPDHIDLQHQRLLQFCWGWAHHKLPEQSLLFEGVHSSVDLYQV